MTTATIDLTCPACGASLTVIDTRTGLSPAPTAVSDLAVTCNGCDYAAIQYEHEAVINAIARAKAEVKAACSDGGLLTIDGDLPETMPEGFLRDAGAGLKDQQVSMVAGAIARWIEAGELQYELTEAGILCEHCNRRVEDDGLCMVHLEARDEARREDRWGV